jgi:hypothetical protein
MGRLAVGLCVGIVVGYGVAQWKVAAPSAVHVGTVEISVQRRSVRNPHWDNDKPEYMQCMVRLVADGLGGYDVPIEDVRWCDRAGVKVR